MGTVEASITALKEKKAWYSVQPRPPRKTAEERAAELAEKEKAKEEAKAAAGEGGAGAGGKEGGKPKKEKKQPKEFKSCESPVGSCPVWLCRSLGACLVPLARLSLTLPHLNHHHHSRGGLPRAWGGPRQGQRQRRAGLSGEARRASLHVPQAPRCLLCVGGGRARWVCGRG